MHLRITWVSLLISLYVVMCGMYVCIDMGFEPQVCAVLETMGGLLKSEDEAQAEGEMAMAQVPYCLCTPCYVYL